MFVVVFLIGAALVFNGLRIGMHDLDHNLNDDGEPNAEFGKYRPMLQFLAGWVTMIITLGVKAGL